MNGRNFGNGFWVTPDARADNGLLDVLVFEELDRVAILRMLPKMMKGTHLNEPVLRLYQARLVVIESSHPLIVETDGEVPYQNANRLEVEVLTKTLRVLTRIEGLYHGDRRHDCSRDGSIKWYRRGERQGACQERLAPCIVAFPQRG
ncbi:MAG: hypothetical protein PVG14_09020 [Anaerolineales bacterium]